MKISLKFAIPLIGAACLSPFVAWAVLSHATTGDADGEAFEAAATEETVPEHAERSDEFGFAVSSIGFALGEDANAPIACPKGFSKGFIAAYEAAGGDIRLREGEAAQDYNVRMYAAASRSDAPGKGGVCLNPGARPDPFFRTVAPVDVIAEGVDLDGQASRADGDPAPGTCAHDDFSSASGARAIDNQMYRVLGCVTGYQETGASRDVSASMLAGAWTIVINLTGVDSLENDEDVEVGIYSSLDSLHVSPARAPLEYASYTADEDPRFRAVARGRIVDGVLTTEPVDLKLRWAAEAWNLVRPLNHARLRLEISKDGASGLLSGYTPIDEWFANNYNYDAAKTPEGEPADAGYRWYSSIGTANSQGFTCNGLYQAMHEAADGDRDPETGACASLSTHYRIKAVPAFVMTNNN